MKAVQVAPPIATKPAEGGAHAERGRVLRALRAVFFWRVRFSLRTLLVLAAGLSAAIGAKLKFDENPWQPAWRWTAPANEEVGAAAVSPDGKRMAVGVYAVEPLADGSRPGRVLTFGAPDFQSHEALRDLPCEDGSSDLHWNGRKNGSRSSVRPRLTLAEGQMELRFNSRGQLTAFLGREVYSGDLGRKILTFPPDLKFEGSGANGDVAVTSENGKAPYFVWDLDGRTQRCTLPLGNWCLDGPYSTPEGMRAVTLRAQENTAVDLWDLGNGRRLKTFEHDKTVLGAALSPDGRWLLAGGDGFVRLWDVAGHRVKGDFSIQGGCLGGALGPNGTCAFVWICTTYYRETGIHPWLMRMDTGQLVKEVPYPFDGKDPSPFPAFGPDGRYYCHPTPDGLRIADALSGKVRWTLPLPPSLADSRETLPAVAAEAPALLVYGPGGVVRFELVRPEGPDRIFWLPEFWLAAIFALLLPLSLRRDGQMKQP